MTRLDRRAWLVVLVVVAAQMRFVVLDDRLPRDLSFTWRMLESSMAAWTHHRWDQFPRMLSETAGWLNLAVAGVFQLTGPGPKLFRALDVVWLGLMMASTRSVARTLGGPRAGLAAVLLLAGLPLAIVMARLTWVHVPETALLVAVLAVVVKDPELRHRRTHFSGLALAGLALTLRPSAMIWLAACLPVVWGAPRRRRRQMLAGLLICAVPALMELGPYLTGKLAIRQDYAARVAPLFDQLLTLVGPWAGLPALIGVYLWFRTKPASPVRWTLAAWMVGPFLAWGVFRAGLENFVVLAPGLAIAGALGLARGRRGLVAAGLGFALLTGVQVAPTDTAENLWGRLPGATPGWYRESLGDQFRPWTGYGATELPRLLDAVCPTRAANRCLVAVEQGLFFPDSEDPGRLGLLLLDEQRVDLRIVSQEPRPLPGAAAVVRFECPGQPQGVRVALPDLGPVWTQDIGQGCTVQWLVPGAKAIRPQALPQALPQTKETH
jgi:hypothetical protein